MPQQQRLLQLPLVGTILLCVLVCLYLVARKRSEKPGSAGSVRKHSVETAPDEVLKYWTADRMRNAKPAPLPNVKALKRGKRQVQRPPSEPEHS